MSLLICFENEEKYIELKILINTICSIKTCYLNRIEAKSNYDYNLDTILKNPLCDVNFILLLDISDTFKSLWDYTCNLGKKTIYIGSNKYNDIYFDYKIDNNYFHGIELKNQIQNILTTGYKKINILSVATEIPKASTSEANIFYRFLNFCKKYKINYDINRIDYENYDINIFFSVWCKGHFIYNSIIKLIEDNKTIKTKCVFYAYLFNFIKSNSKDINTKFLKIFTDEIFLAETFKQYLEYPSYFIQGQIINTITLPIGLNIEEFENINYINNNEVTICIKEHSRIKFPLEKIKFLTDLIKNKINIFYYSLDDDIKRFDQQDFFSTIKKK